MSEREIIGGGGYQVVKCGHCDGKGKCNCPTCLKAAGWEFSLRYISSDEYKRIVNSGATGVCTICGGTGWLVLTPEGELKPGRVKKEEKKE